MDTTAPDPPGGVGCDIMKVYSLTQRYKKNYAMYAGKSAMVIHWQKAILVLTCSHGCGSYKYSM